MHSACFRNFFLQCTCTMGLVVRGAKYPWGEMSVGQNVRGAKCPWGEMFVGRNVRGARCRGARCHGARCRGARCRGASCRGASCPGASCPGASCLGASGQPVSPFTPLIFLARFFHLGRHYFYGLLLDHVLDFLVLPTIGTRTAL